jgi:hypothetical protein
VTYEFKRSDDGLDAVHPFATAELKPERLRQYSPGLTEFDEGYPGMMSD